MVGIIHQENEGSPLIYAPRRSLMGTYYHNRASGGRQERIPRNHVKDRDWVQVGDLDCSPTLETGSCTTHSSFL